MQTDLQARLREQRWNHLVSMLRKAKLCPETRYISGRPGFALHIVSMLAVRGDLVLLLVSHLIFEIGIYVVPSSMTSSDLSYEQPLLVVGSNYNGAQTNVLDLVSHSKHIIDIYRWQRLRAG